MENKTVKVTNMEAAVLDHIARNCYGALNYGKPTNVEDATNEIWRHSILDSGSTTAVAPRSLPGICSSLAKKGFIGTKEDGKDSTVWMTEAGYNAWLTTEPAKADCKFA